MELGSGELSLFEKSSRSRDDQDGKIYRIEGAKGGKDEKVTKE